MIRDSLQQIVASAVANLVQSGQLPEAVRSVRIEITDTKQPEHGDFACNFALVASKPAGMNPRQLGEMLKDGIMAVGHDGVAAPNAGTPQSQNAARPINSIEIAGPGFLNLRLNPEWVSSFVPQVLALGETLPIKQSSNPATQQSINVEFVSVNPNGPITIGSGRGAAYGSTLCNVLEAAGNKVHREYYINDGVNSEQMRLFAESVRSIIQGKKIPSRGYKGDYVHAVAREIVPLLGGFASKRKDTEDFRETDDTVPYVFAQIDARHGTKLLQFADKPEELANNARVLKDASVLLGSRIPRFLSLFVGVFPFEARNQELDATRNKVLMALAIAINWDNYLTSSGKVGPTYIQEYKYALQREVLHESLKRYMTMPENELAHEAKLNPLWDVLLASHATLDDVDQGVRLLRASLSEPNEFTKHLLKGKRLTKYQGAAQDLMVSRQRRDLKTFGVVFGTWFSEQSLHNSGEVAKEMEQMVASQVADDREIRTVLKLAKGGVIDDVILEDQAGKAEVDDDHGAEPGTADLQIGEQAGTELQATGGTTDSGADLEIGGPSKTLWLRSAKFGDDMDRVLKRRDGRLTYIASDVAYHKDKLTDASGVRGTGPVDKMITVLGPDHHGYIGRLQAVVAAMLKAEGIVHRDSSIAESDAPLTDLEAKIYSSPEERDLCKAALAEAKRKLEVQIFQLVRFVKDGKPAPMRKRDGNIYALIDLMREIGENVKPNGTEEEKLEAGKDVARFFYLMRSHDTTFDFDLDLAQKQSDENPVFYVQYAHARICSVISKAEASGITALRHNGAPDKPSEEPQSRTAETPAYALLSHERELTLIKKICDLPFEVQRCAEDYGVHRLTTFAIELARTYHHFYDACRVIQPEEPELSRARLALCEATRLALKGTLDLLGISAPNRMERAE